MMITAAFIDFSCNVFDKLHVYTLHSYIKSKGVNVLYINETTFDKAIRQIQQLRPDLLMYSAFSTDVHIYMAFDRVLKQVYPVKSIIGGAAPTFDFSLAQKSSIDAFCVGEGELALNEYIESGFTLGRNIIARGGAEPQGLQSFIDLDTIPIPDRSLVYDKNPVLRYMTTKQFMIGRGCPYQCTYCHNHAFNWMFRHSGRIVRRKSVDYVIEEIRETMRHYPLTNILFHDDMFLTDRNWVLEFCGKFPREINVNYAILARANHINETIAQALKDSGCIFVSWSIECANDHIRNDILKRRMSREQILEAARIFNKYGIGHKTGNLLGLPGETFEDMLDTLRLNIVARPSISLASILTPYPGLEITQYAIDNNFVTKKALENLPPDCFTESALDFSPQEKRRISRLSWLFPFLVDHPALVRNRKVLDALLRFPLPKVFVRAFFEIYYLIKYSRQFKVNTPLYVSWLVFKIHLMERLRLYNPGKGYLKGKGKSQLSEQET